MSWRTGLEYAKKRLYEVTAARCRGPTVVVQPGASHLAQAVRDRGRDVVEVSGSLCDGLSRLESGFGTVVLHGVLQEPGAEADEIVASAWNLLEAGGQLIVTVPNKESARRSRRAGALSRRRLKRILAPLGQVFLATDQPFRWLTMYVEKPGGRRRLQRSWRDRYRVTARLCRGTVLDLGCGEGHLSKTIADRGLDVTGVDLSAEKIRRARATYPQLRVVESDIRDLRMTPEAFDTVILAEVLEHVSEEVGAEILAKAWELLKVGGRLIVSVPNEDCIPHPHHVRRFDRRLLRRLLTPLGKPKLVTRQPYKWLMMHVTKRAE